MNGRRLPLRLGVVLVLGLVMPLFPVEGRKPIVPGGALALSVGESVVLVDPAASKVRTLETGPVGFLFPAPSAVLFAPDVIDNRTTVIDMRSGRVLEVINGVTMPHFGPWPDRYLVVGGSLTMVSYPERSLIFKMEGEFTRPWQVELGPEGTTVLILERKPSGEGGATITAVDLISRRVVYSRHFDHDIVRFAMAPASGVMAVVDRTAGDLALLEPRSLDELMRIAVEGTVTDVLALNEGKLLIIAGPDGRLERWKIKKKKDHPVPEAEKGIPIPGRAVRIVAGPDGRLVAAVTDRKELVIVDSKKGDLLGRWELPGDARDLEWIDLSRRGPLLPLWSDRSVGPEGADLGIPGKEKH